MMHSKWLRCTVRSAALGAGVILTACGDDSGSVTTTTLTARDFAAPPSATLPAPRKPAAHDETIRRGEVEATGGIDDVHVLVGSPVVEAKPVPPLTPATPAQPGEGATAASPEGAPAAPSAPAAPARTDAVGAPLALGAALVDSMVGQINGRPVFASEFFAPMDARLRAEARSAPTREEWFFGPGGRGGGARDQIRGALIDTMRDELLLAEFEGSLSPEQRMGVLAFVQDLRGNLTSLAEGSKELAERRLLESEGVTLEQKVQLERDRELIRAQVNKAIGDRAYVAWREVVQAYERDYDKYHPAPIATLRVIQIPLRDEERLARVAAALGAGEEWAAVASRESAFNAREGGRYEVKVAPEGYSKTTFYSGEPLNEAARALTVGNETTLDFAGSRFWLRLEAIDEEPARRLYDVQRPINELLYARRMGEEESKYFNRLLTTQTASDLEQMVGRLERIAVERYAPLLVNKPSRAGTRPVPTPGQ